MRAPGSGDRGLCKARYQISVILGSSPSLLPGEYLVAELGRRPVDQLPAILTAGVAVLVSPGRGDHKAQAQLGI